MSCSSWGCKESDMTERLNCNCCTLLFVSRMHGLFLTQTVSSLSVDYSYQTTGTDT